MNKTTVSVQETSNPKIIKFETNSFLTKYESFEFSNIDEAKNSPLAQQLFHLPFVKKVDVKPKIPPFGRCIVHGLLLKYEKYALYNRGSLTDL